MGGALELIRHGFTDAFLMAWQVWWALVLGFAISAIVQAWVPRERVERSLRGTGPRPVARATLLGAASSSCSYAAVAIAKSLFQKGASTATALAFQIASTNLVWELGLVVWVLIGWQFAAAEYGGGAVMIVLVALLVRSLVNARLEAQARVRASRAGAVHQHPPAAASSAWRSRLLSLDGWSDVAWNFCGDWRVMWKEITLGLLVAGFAAQLGNHFFDSLFLPHAAGAIRALENVIVGPLIAIVSFVCSVGNVPLAAVLWSGGISFSGVLAFLLADLVVLPIVAIYEKLYGAAFTLRITASLLAAIPLAALAVGALFGLLGLIPSGSRPTRADVFPSVELNYELVLNLVGLFIFGTFVGLTARSDRRDHHGHHH